MDLGWKVMFPLSLLNIVYRHFYLLWVDLNYVGEKEKRDIARAYIS